MTVLSVNLNKIALLRNARGEGEPDLARAAGVCIEAGCAGLTVHPRPDLRHVRPADVAMLAKLTRAAGVEFNIEGNPLAAPRGAYPGLLALCAAARPQQVTLVPDGDGQLTSDHGFDAATDGPPLAPIIERLQACCGRVSLFVDSGIEDLHAFAEAGADRVELYTGPFAAACAGGDPSLALRACKATAEAAAAAGLGVNAGHDLKQANLGALLQAVPEVAEVSIGHALIGEALYAGLASTVSAYVAILAAHRHTGGN